MGNCSGKRHKKTEPLAKGEKRKIINAQNNFVRNLVSTTEAEDEVDGDSIGPGKSTCCNLDWHQSLKQIFIRVSFHILVASLTLMALF